MSQFDDTDNPLNHFDGDETLREESSLHIDGLDQLTESPSAEDSEARSAPSVHSSNRSSDPSMDLFALLDEGTKTSGRPKHNLYSPGAVAWAALWGGYLGGGLVLARNYWVLGRRREAIAVVLGLSVLTLALMLFIPLKFSGVAIILAAALAWALASYLQGNLCRTHVRAKGSMGTGLGAFGYGVLGTLLTVALAGGSSALLAKTLGTRLSIGRDHEVYYSRGATAKEARRLGNFLITNGLVLAQRE